MPTIFDTYGTFDVLDIEREYLRSAYAEAKRNGDETRCAMIAHNLRNLDSASRCA